MLAISRLFAFTVRPQKSCQFLGCLIITLLGLGQVFAQAPEPPVVTSLEYKVLLDPARFADTPATSANDFLTALQGALAAGNFDKTIKKTFKPDKNRLVHFYDTAGTCKLKQASHISRERTRTDNGKREIMVKFRATGLDQIQGVDLHGISDDASTKLEADITPRSLVYSYSTKQTIGNQPIAAFADLQLLYPSLAAPGMAPEDMLSEVNGLTITEQTYPARHPTWGSKLPSSA